MLKNSIVYRRLWYVKKRNIGRMQVLLRLLAAGAILAFFLTLVNGSLVPRLKSIAEYRIKSTMMEIMVSYVQDNVKTGLLSGGIQDKLSILENTTVPVPLYALFEKAGTMVDYSERPALYVAIKQVSNVKADFDGQFVRITAVFNYSGPLTEGVVEVEASIPPD